MNDIVIISEHRVGSRWMHLLFAELFGVNKSPELDSKRLYSKTYRAKVIDRLSQKRIVKFHHATPNQAIEGITVAGKEEKYDLDLKILGIVRNPRDQGVSLCFHNRYHDKNNTFDEQDYETDEEALEYTIFKSPWYQIENIRQLQLMVDGHSTEYYEMGYNGRDHFNRMPYIWTTYEKLKENTVREVKAITSFFGIERSDMQIARIVESNDFKQRSGREVGEEKREDLWRRKGDWENHFDSNMVMKTQFLSDMYWQIVKRNFDL